MFCVCTILDKNRAPEAEEAFKKVNAAFQCLSDPRKRSYYDQTGEEEGERRLPSYSTGTPYYQRDQDLSPEDVFNMFFGGGFQGMNGRRVYTNFGRVHRQQHQQRQQEAGQGGSQSPLASLMPFLQFLPLILMFLFSVFSASSSYDNTDHFSLTPTPPFNFLRTVKPYGLQYYVQPQFNQRYGSDPRTISQIELIVKREYLKRFTMECTALKQRKAALEKRLDNASGDDHDRLLQELEKLSEEEPCKKAHELKR